MRGRWEFGGLLRRHARSHGPSSDLLNRFHLSRILLDRSSNLKNAQTLLVLILLVSSLVSVSMYAIFSGSYVRTSAADQFTYWIGPSSTTIPFFFWALITLVIGTMQQGQRTHVFSTMNGYAAGWVAMTAYGCWIVSLPAGPPSTSTMGIAVVFTPMVFLLIFPIPFGAGYFAARKFLRHRWTTE